LNGGANEKFGIGRSLSVMPGDKITAEVYAKYVDTNPNNVQAWLNTLLTQIAAGTAPAGTVVDGGSYSTSTSSFPFPVQATQLTANSVEPGPKAYLNWLVFDRDYNLILSKCGYDRISTDAKETGQNNTDHERLFSPEIEITEPGYVYIYLSNEEGTPVEVFFDNFKVEQVKGKVVQMDDYYPFGLSFNSYTRENSVHQDFNYNKKELQDELSLNWLDYGARMYMSDIGRWGVMDPLAELYRSWSPYSYALNSPSTLVDLEGLAIGDPKYTGSGSVVIIIADIPSEVDNGYWNTNPLDGTSWDYGVFNSLTDAQSWLEGTYGKDKKKIHDLIIRSHGFVGDGPARHAINVQGTDPQFIRANDLNEGEGKNVEALTRMSVYLGLGAKVLFTACGASQQGTVLAEALFNALSGREKYLEVFTNGSNTKLQDMNGIKVQKDLNAKAHR
jgi:RHS repeat-associated protein